MRQFVVRLDEALHARLKRRALDDRRSMNAVISEILERELGSVDQRAAVRRRAEALNLLVLPPKPARIPSWAAVERAGRGAGGAVSRALAADRARR